MALPKENHYSQFDDQFLDGHENDYAPQTNFICDLCGNLYKENFIHETEAGLFLCASCLYYMKNSCSHVTEKAIERVLIGNVI